MNDKLWQKLTAWRRQLHRHPERSMREYETTRQIKQWLAQEGIDLLPFSPETGVTAQITGGLPGPAIALRADIDALPIQEQTGLPYASVTDGVSHACGHDFHTCVMLGAAILLKERQAALKGSVRFLFQPSEENADGAEWMIKQGVLEGVEAIFGCHNRPDLPLRTIGVREGPLMAGVDRFVITVEGAGGHAGIPQLCADPIVAASQLVTALQTLVSRNLSPFESAVVSVTRFTAGNTWNVIPQNAQIEGTVRTFGAAVREKIPGLISRIAQATAAAFGTRAQILWDAKMPSVDNDPRFTDVILETARMEKLDTVEAEQSAGGEDFACYQSRIPGYFLWVGVDGPREWHDPAFQINEDALPGAAAYFAALAENVLGRWDEIMR